MDDHAPVVVFALDESLDLDEVQAMRDSVSRAVWRLPRRTRVGLVAFSGAVSVYDLRAGASQSRSGVSRKTAIAAIVPGNRSPDADGLMFARAEREGGAKRFTVSLSSDGAMDAIETVLKSLKPAGRRAGDVRSRPRCFGAAIETAAAVVRGFREDSNARTGGGRVIACVGGPPTRGPGAAAEDETSEFYKVEERSARLYVEDLAETVRGDSEAHRDAPFPSKFPAR
jgi:protein transport protein SEC23